MCALLWMLQYMDDLGLIGLSPPADVYHKHNQDKEQSAGQASAVLGDPLYSLPDRPQPGLRVPEPLFRRDCRLHPRHGSGPVFGRSAFLLPLLPFYVLCVKSWLTDFPRVQSELLLPMSPTSMQKSSKEHVCFSTRRESEFLYFEKYDSPCFLKESRRMQSSRKMAMLCARAVSLITKTDSMVCPRVSV